MIWAQAYETNLDRLRRYAAFSCGSEGLGDGVVSKALSHVLTDVSTAETENLIALFQKLDATLQKSPPATDSLFAELGRWQSLSPLQRRVILLCVVERFSAREAAQITGLSRGEVKAILARARLVYADRFPARLGLIGGDDRVCGVIETSLLSVGHSLRWRIAADGKHDPATLPPASLVVVAHEGASLQQALVLCGGYAVPVILADDGASEDRLSLRHWTLPKDSLSDQTLFSSMLIRALLFSD